MDGREPSPSSRRDNGSHMSRSRSHATDRASRRDSNVSDASFITNVSMAQDEVFAGPVSESVPSSRASFSHRRSTTHDSNVSFTYLENDDHRSEEHAVEETDDENAVGIVRPPTPDLEEGLPVSPRRKSSLFSRASVGDSLLRRYSSARTDANGQRIERMNQKVYIQTEDITIAIAGFKTKSIGYGIYVCICILTFGLGYLLLRWLPRWRVRLIGVPTPLRDCTWVVIENEWRELTILEICKESYGHAVSTVFGIQEKTTFNAYDEEDNDPIMDYLRYLDYRYIRFCFHPIKNKFVLINGWKDPNWIDTTRIRSGIDEEEEERREKVFGKNLIDIQQKSIFQLLVDEVFHPFYVFQVASLILWCTDEYYYYAICIFLISVISVTTTLLETRSTMQRLRNISKFVCEVRVLRNGFWGSVDSSELVPGDVFEISDASLTQLPCDSLLLSGDCIINESMLTGESVPVSKTPATDETLEKLDLSASTVHSDVAKHFLFCGTKIIRARRPQASEDDEAVALAMVTRTGFNTTKGALVRSMLFPKPSGFKFYRDSFRYISVMAGIACLGFIASFINFVRLGLAWHLIIVRALDLITIIVPPALPATLSIGTNFALSRLRKNQIFCISPQRVNVGGKLDLICFDKTGTLTEDGLDVLGVRIADRVGNRFSKLIESSSSLLVPVANYERDPTMDFETSKSVLYTMATCHALRTVDGELVGDPLDLKMFEFSKWLFDESGNQSGSHRHEGHGLIPAVATPPPEMEYALNGATGCQKTSIALGVLRNFEFVSQLRRASVVVRQFGATGCDIYVKGAPECMPEICKLGSFPSDYDELLSYYTHRGFRVIACATKHIPKLSWVKVQKMSRAEAESELTFIGFIIFENKLKETTTEIIKELNNAHVRTVMCTGDNILTAVSVARECHLVDKDSHCFVPHFLEGDHTMPRARIGWESVDNSIYQLDEKTLLPIPPPPELDLSAPFDAASFQNFYLALTGETFRWIIDYGSEEMVKRMLVRGQIFARMSPDEKHELVEKLQSIDYCCGFCGDGANDCGALKAADVGISLSEAEASVAAPFTSRVFDISCVPQVIKEGRAALVTSFCCFKYMSLYSAIQFTTVSFLYASASNLGDFQFLLIDLFLILPIAIFMGWTGPYPVLARKHPTASLVSRKILVPLIGQIAICLVIQLIGFEVVQQQSWFIPPKLNLEKSNITNSENTTLFLLSCYQYILSAFVLSVGKPFRQPMRSNLPLVVTILTALGFVSYLLFDPSRWLFNFMQLTKMTVSFKVFILLLALGGFVVSWTGEKKFLPWLASAIGHLRVRFRAGQQKKRKEYKVLLENMQI